MKTNKTNCILISQIISYYEIRLLEKIKNIFKFILSSTRTHVAELPIHCAVYKYHKYCDKYLHFEWCNLTIHQLSCLFYISQHYDRNELLKLYYELIMTY